MTNESNANTIGDRANMIKKYLMQKTVTEDVP